VKGLDSVAKFFEGALEANKDTHEIQEGEGCEGLRKVFPQNTKKGLYIGKNHEKPFTPFISTSIENGHQTSLEADGGHNQREKQPFTKNTTTRRMGGIYLMMLMLLLSELTHLQVHLSDTSEGLHVQAPAGVLTDELRQAMAEHKADLLCFAHFPCVETIDGTGMLTGDRRAFGIIEFVAPERQERLRYTIGVRLTRDGLERFYLPGTLWLTEQSGSE
jgi:hypothetical protein